MDFMLYHHLGMGDHIICHGLVRRLYEQKSFTKFKLITKKHYADNVQFMYSDLENLDVIEVQDDNEANQILQKHRGEKLKHFAPYGRPDLFTEEAAYTALGFDINDRYDYFNINRDIERENFVYNKIIDFDGDYIFIADDPTRNFTIDNMKAKMSRNVKIIRSSNLLEYTIFDLLKVIENALDSHTIYSAFMTLIDCMGPEFSKLYIHESYIKKIYPSWPNDKKLINYWNKRNVQII